jgi:hypothetical protein
MSESSETPETRRTLKDYRPLLEQLVDAVSRVELPSVCECGHLYDQHKFIDDKIYDVQELLCPDGVWPRDYRYDAIKSKAVQREVQIAEAAIVLDALLSSESFSPSDATKRSEG